MSGSDNPVDSLLKSAFDLTDVQDSVTVNKIMEESAQLHIKKIVNMQQKILRISHPPLVQIGGQVVLSGAFVA